MVLRPKQPILKFRIVGRTGYTLLINQVVEPESQVTSLTIKVSLLWSEVLLTDRWQKLEKYLQLYLKLDGVSSMTCFNTASCSCLEKRS